MITRFIFDAEMFGEQLDRPVSYYFDATMFDDTAEAEERLRRYVREDVIEWTSKPIIADIKQIGSPPETSGSRIKPFSPLIGGVVVGSRRKLSGGLKKRDSSTVDNLILMFHLTPNYSKWT